MLHTKGPKFRKFSTAEEAREFVKDWKVYSLKEKAATLAATAAEEEDEEDDDDDDDDESDGSDLGPTAKRLKVNKSVTVGKGKSKEVKVEKVYTDGSSLGNGKAGSSAGIGVYFGPNDPRYVHAHPSPSPFSHPTQHHPTSTPQTKY